MSQEVDCQKCMYNEECASIVMTGLEAIRKTTGALKFHFRVEKCIRFQEQETAGETKYDAPDA